MLTYATIILAIAAVGGLILAAHVLRDKFAPWSLSLLHAALGATSLILLVLVLTQGNYPQLVLIAFILILIAALGGFYLTSFHVRKRIPKTNIVVLHACVAVAGFLTLVAAIL